MSDEQRLDAVLAALRDTPEPPVACALHTAVFDALADPATSLTEDHLDQVDDSLSCDACAEALAHHPFLDAALLDLPLPPPALPAVVTPRSAPGRLRRLWPVALLALAAALLLFALVDQPVAPPARPGPTAAAPGPIQDGHPAYAYVHLDGPRADGKPSYAWVPRPESAEAYHFDPPDDQDPGRMAANYVYNPWAWR